MAINESGTVTVRLDSTFHSHVLIEVKEEIEEIISGLEGYKIGIMFGIVDLRLQVSLSEYDQAILPVIRPEDSTARKVSQTNTSELASSRIGVELRVDDKPIVRKRVVNYGKGNTIPLLSRMSESNKYLKRKNVMSVHLIDLGYGLINNDDYIDVTCDYIIELTAMEVSKRLSLNFEGEDG